MNFHNWWRWVKSLPLPLSWFVWLMLLRPIIDVFYFLKRVSPFLSPLYLVGVLTPILILASYCSRSFPRRKPSAADMPMGMWGVFLLFNVVAGFSFGWSLHMLEMALRITLPFFLYFYLRHFMRSREDLMGLVTTFFYSTAFAFTMLIYERAVSPLRQVIVTRGHTRYEGLFADVNSYSAYIAGGFLIAAFFFMEQYGHSSLRKRTLRLAGIGALSVVALLSMHHAASWGIFAAIVLLLMFHALQGGQVRLSLLLLMLAIPTYFVVGNKITERVASMYTREVEVLQGERDMSYAFHGRMSRWQRHVGEWSDMPVVAKVFGVAMHAPPTVSKVGAGIHNDYLRVLFASGWVGLFLYLSFYVILVGKTFFLPVADRFLVRGSIAMVLLYSITATATTSMPVLYLAMSIFAYGALPRPVTSPVPVRVPDYSGRYRPRIARV